MPRPPRADEAGAIYHALNRGNSRQDIFRKDADYEAFERVLADGLEKHPVDLFAYQWMPNHWHMVLSPREDGVMSRLLYWTTMTHSQRFVELPEAILVHGFFEPGLPLADQRETVLVGILYRFRTQSARLLDGAARAVRRYPILGHIRSRSYVGSREDPRQLGANTKLPATRSSSEMRTAG